MIGSLELIQDCEMRAKKSILVVDDSEEDVELVSIGLQEEGIAPDTIDVAYDGEEALDYLYRRGKFHGRVNDDPAVIFLDLKMPKVDGFEVLEAIRKDTNFKAIPIVIFTSSRENRDIVRSYAVGANAYVLKPLDSFQFMDTIRQLARFWININLLPA